MSEFDSKNQSISQPRGVTSRVSALTRSETVEDGQTDLAFLTLVGKKTSDGKVKIMTSAASDGTENPYGILARATDADGSDERAPVYVKGEFIEDAIVLGTGVTWTEALRAQLRDLGIFTTTEINPNP